MASSVSQAGIALTTVYFFNDHLPARIALRDTALPLSGPCPMALAALHGHRGKREGLMAARQYADAGGLRYTVVDFLLIPDAPIRHERITFADLASQDIVFIDQLTRAGLEAIYELMEERSGSLALDRGKHFKQDFDALVQQRPEVLGTLFEAPKMAHVKALVYSGKTAFNDRPLPIALVSHRHWSAIAEAACRLDPATLVDLAST